MKTDVLDVIGETGLQHAAAVNAALAANDRVKFLFSLLQMALSHAAHPDQPAAGLRRERLAAGVEDASLDAVVAGARRAGPRVAIPSARAVLARVAAEMRLMAAPVLAGPQGDEFAARLEALLAEMPQAADDLVDPAAIAAMTQAGRRGEDSLHQLVMDLHRALNAMQAALARETLDGAAVYGLDDERDRARVRAFMAGVNRTAPLKFDHPGLATTATRSGERLVIQNDIGTTDAHVIVVHVEGLVAEVTYTDVHAERLAFLQSLFDRFPVSWTGTDTRLAAGLAEGAPFHMTVGRLEATDEAGLLAWLDVLGSRLVFLIDWNRARKALRPFLRGPARVDVLRWAADEELGHRGFLELGGPRLIYDAIEAAAGSAMHFGDRLCDVLGDAAAEAFVRFVLRTASEGLRARRSQRLIRDRIRAELQTHFSNEGRRLLGRASDHAGLVFEIATLVRDGIAAVGAGEGGFDRLARRARRFEHDADEILAELREAVRRRSDHAAVLRLTESADDAADQLEEAAFLLELLAGLDPAGRVIDRLTALADLLVEGAQEWIKALGHAGSIGTEGGGPLHEDADDFLVAIDRVLALEHAADDAERALRHAAVQHAQHFRQLHLYSEIGRALEEAADALKRSGLITRDVVLGNAMPV
ncbi:DUF47 family protein [Rhodovastum atsumiense]|uniref:DUF47 family protein n=1 Tax=Rhodovastum atsumiense TaxID=504468 RepID=A0A5M6J235_9PROT|nr:DUF47 family protein [Rhodovastum atsumiense]KAA5614147.1 DUF47 family protein [Rhodovastum atsumiense]CAH2599000.1 DUF47 family protein [Rhodovastum atsumiense]